MFFKPSSCFILSLLILLNWLCSFSYLLGFYSNRKTSSACEFVASLFVGEMFVCGQVCQSSKPTTNMFHQICTCGKKSRISMYQLPEAWRYRLGLLFKNYCLSRDPDNGMDLCFPRKCEQRSVGSATVANFPFEIMHGVRNTQTLCVG